MADKVPYTGVPDAQYSDRPTPEMHVDAPAEAFGVGVAHAVQGMGEMQEGAGKELFARALAFQDLTNHATARGAAVKTAQEQATIWSEFDQKGGLQAGPEALTQVQKDLEAVRQKNGKDLNPTAAELYQNDAASLQSRLYLYSASHSATAIKQYNKETIDADVATTNNLATAAAHQDPKILDQAFAKNVAANTLHGHQDGYDPNSSIGQANLIKLNNNTSLGVVKGFFDRHDPEEMAKFIADAEKKGRLTGEAADEAHKILTSSQQSILSKKIADNHNDPKLPLADKIDSAVKDADKASGGDVNVAAATAARVEANHNIQSAEATDARNKANSTIDKAFLQMRGGQPKSIDDFMKDPDFKSAYDTLARDPDKGGQTQTEVLNRYNKTIKDDNDLTDERRITTNVLTGIAHGDHPEQFLKVDLWKENLTANQRSELIKVQQAMQTSGTSGFRDKATESIMTRMKPQIKAAIGDPGTTDYNDFRGALQVEFDLAREGGKIVTPEMAEMLATKLMQSKVLSKGWIYNSTGPAYKPSADEAANIRRQLGEHLTDEQVQRAYLKKLSDVLDGPADKPKTTNRVEAPNGQ